MKKLFALILMAAMMLSMSVAAFACTDEPDGESGNSAETVYTVGKIYVDEDGERSEDFPRERLSFIVTAAEGNPDDTMISIADHAVKQNPDKILINVPEYTKVGKYNYTVKEQTGSTQGVIYMDASFQVQVLAQWNEDHSKIITTLSFTTLQGDHEKADTFVNRYDLGTLEIEKEVTGNLGSYQQEFLVDVTFTAEEGKTVRSDLCYEADGQILKITPEDMADGTETVTVSLKHDEEVEFYNLPAGITYTVRERDYTGGNVNDQDAGYDAPVYEVEEDEGQITSNGVTGMITEENDDVDIDIINNKGTVVETGVFLDSAPYLVMLGAAVLGGVLLVMKKRPTV